MCQMSFDDVKFQLSRLGVCDFGQRLLLNVLTDLCVIILLRQYVLLLILN